MKNLSIDFDVFGNEDTGSSRLRAWRIAEQLRRMGHNATVGQNESADICVFQKNRNFKRLAQAKRKDSLIVFDFDDNYLIDDVGTKNDVLRFINFADVVTVGSQLLFDIAQTYHPRVYLFENPLDIIDSDNIKQQYYWEAKARLVRKPLQPASALRAQSSLGSNYYYQGWRYRVVS